MAQPPKRPTTRRPRGSGTTTRRSTTRKSTTATPAADAPAKPKRGRPAKAAPAPTAAAPAAPVAPKAPKAPARRTRASSKPASPAPAPARSKQRHDQAEHQARDSHGRFKVSRRARNVALGVGGAVLAVGAGIGTALWRGWVKMPRGPFRGAEGHRAPDLALDAPKPGTGRAPADFRPDPTAVPTQEERDAMRPIAAD